MIGVIQANLAFCNTSLLFNRIDYYLEPVLNNTKSPKEPSST